MPYSTSAECNVDSKAAPQMLRRFDSYFRVQEVESLSMLESALALRYQVYCLERKFEEPERFPNCLEADQYDDRSVHGLLFYKLCDEAIGTARLVLSEGEHCALPIQSVLGKCDINAARYFPVHSAAEVSRFAISREFRRRPADPPTSEMVSGRDECLNNLPSLGLIRILFQMSLARGITHWSAVMEPTLLRLLATIGVHFVPIGPRVLYHGIRQPAFCHLPTMLETLLREKPQHWNIVTNGGRLAFSLNETVNKTATNTLVAN